VARAAEKREERRARKQSKNMASVEIEAEPQDMPGDTPEVEEEGVN
jgi:hypothetical protein